jgi:hypothetical protein
MAAKACLRSGAGMITIGVPETLMNVYQNVLLKRWSCLCRIRRGYSFRRGLVTYSGFFEQES